MHRHSGAALAVISISLLTATSARADDKAECLGSKIAVKIETCSRLLGNPALPKPERVTYLGHRARGLIEALEFDKAALDIKVMFKLMPASVFGHQVQGRLHEARDKPDLARGEYDLAVNLARNKYLPLVNRGGFYLRTNENGKAEADFTSASGLEPAKASPQVGRGIALRRKGDTAAALATFNRAIQLEPNFLSAYLERGQLHLEEKSLTLAAADFDKALAIDPASTKAATGRQAARALISAAATPVAPQTATTSTPPIPATAAPAPALPAPTSPVPVAPVPVAPVTAAPVTPAPTVTPPVVASPPVVVAPVVPPATTPAVVADPAPATAPTPPPAPKPKKAAGKKAPATEVVPLTPEQAAEVAQLLETAAAAIKAKKLPEALVAYDAIRKIEPKNVQTLLGRGRVLEDLNRLEEAGNAYGELYEATEEPKSRFEALLGLGRVNTKAGYFAEGVRRTTQAIALDATSPQAFYWRGVAYHRSGRFDLALKDSSEAHTLAPKNATYIGRQALAQAMLGQRDAATQTIAQSLAIDAANPHALTARAQLNLTGGDIAAAETDARAVLAKFGAFIEAQQVSQFIQLHKLFKPTDAPVNANAQ